MLSSACNSEIGSNPEKYRNLQWWSMRTRLERTLCFITVISFLVLFIMVAALAVYGYLHNKNISSQPIITTSKRLMPNSSNLCLTPGCVKAAAKILSNLDESVDPCNDFYSFACGGWMDQHAIPEHKSRVTSFSESEDDLNLKLRVLLEGELNGSEPSFIRMVKSMYNTCMNLETIENTGAKPLKNVLKRLGGWPVVEGNNWDGSKFDWVDTLIQIRELGYSHNILLSLSVWSDYRNSSANILHMDQTEFGMPDRTYLLHGLNDSSTAAYFKLMVKSAKHLGADEKFARKELLEGLQFEIALANISLPQEERRNVSKLYNKYTVNKLQELTSKIPWVKYFSGLLSEGIYENEPVIVAVPDFVVKFADLIMSTDKRIVANYMIWRVVFQSLPILSKEWRDLAHEYNSVLTGKSQEEPRWEQCLSSLQTYLNIALSSYYVRHYFQEESKVAALALVKYIQGEFWNILDDIDWMDDVTKKQAKDKANATISYIGYPQELLNDTAVMELYKNLAITDESYFDNNMRLRKWRRDYFFSYLRKPNIRGDWKKHAAAAVVNAYNYFTENAIELPAGILQNPFFNKDRPHYMNFGGIGYVIGHEITHGFDDTGRQFDKDGNNVNWWAQKTDELYRKKAQCIIDQYSNYTAENGMQVNGINTQGENIADNGGLKEAYLAYRSWVKDHGEEQLLPGLKYTQNQMFWISAASTWCSKFRPEQMKLRILSHPHSPPVFRVIGPMSNLPEFATEFNCSPNSPMNKKQKCQVW